MQPVYNPPPANAQTDTASSSFRPRPCYNAAYPVCAEQTTAPANAFIHQPYACAVPTPDAHQQPENFVWTNASQETQFSDAAFEDNEAGVTLVVPDSGLCVSGAASDSIAAEADPYDPDTKLFVRTAKCDSNAEVSTPPLPDKKLRIRVRKSSRQRKEKIATANLVNEGQCTPRNQQAVTGFPGPPPSPPLRSRITASPTPWDVLSDQVQHSSDEEDTASFEKGIWTTVCRLQEVQRQPRLKTESFELLKCSECTSLWRLQQTTREW